MICGGSIHYLRLPAKTVAEKSNLKERLAEVTEKIFEIRNKALLKKKKSMLKGLYNREIKTGQWAYEHELKKMKYLQQWSAKQGVDFKGIASEIELRRVQEKEDSLLVTLLVSTKYQYVYHDSPSKYNNFRIGTYHSLKLMFKDEKLLISREWYKDPFANSLHLDEINQQQVQKIIAQQSKNLNKLKKRRRTVVEYADQYCGAASLPQYGFKYNSQYKNYNYQGGDCANFASQMLHEGGKFKKNRVWNYKRGAGTKAWVNAQAFNRYMVYSNRATKIAYGSYLKVLKASYKLLPGDYIAYEKQGQVEHISVVTGVDSKGYRLVNCHNSDRYRVPWDLGWNNKGVKFWLVRVHY